MKDNLIGTMTGDSISRFIKFAVNSSQSITIDKLFSVYVENPDITDVRTYDEWREIGRQVNAGEHGIPFKDKNSPYRSGNTYVFDIKQTRGLPKKEKAIDIEVFSQLYEKINELSQQYFQEDISSMKEIVKFKLGIKEKENEDRTSDNTKDGQENTDKIRFDHRGIDGDRRVSRTRENTPVRNQISLFDGFAGASGEIRITSGRVSQIQQLREMVEAKRAIDIGGETLGNRQGSGNVYGTDAQSISSTEHDEFPGIVQPSLGVRTDDTGTDIRGDYQAVRYRLSDDDFIKRSPKERYADNVQAIRTLKSIQKEQRNATLDEQKRLAKYVGWGGLPEVFDENNTSWAKEHKELKELLSVEEYESATNSVLNAHFTPKGVIDGIYAGLARLGVKNAKVLEPSCGTGNFLGAAPLEMNLSFDGVELDELTADIAKALYPTENIKQSGFEDVKIKDGTYDVVIGNVPFGDYKVYDDEYNRHKFVIHDYFLAKSLDKLRPGGIMAVITGKGTFDKQNTKARQYFAERAKLLGAYRLPDTTFKDNAGTEAIADVLFFQKREENIPPTELAKDTIEWMKSIPAHGIDLPMNQYFVNNQENVLGNLSLKSGRFGMERTVAPIYDDIGQALTRFVQDLPENVYYERRETSRNVEKILDVEGKSEIPVYTEEELEEMNCRNFGFCLFNNRVYIRQSEELIEPLKKSLQGELSGKMLERVQGYINLRNQVRKIIDIQSENCSDETLTQEQETLNKLYDGYVKKFGYFNTDYNLNILAEDIDCPLVSSIEKYDEEKETAEKSDIFFKRTIRRTERKTHTDDVYEALALSRGELGEIDLQYIEKLTGLSYEEITEKLKEQIFQRTDVIVEEKQDYRYNGWIAREEYLSGNVVEKLENAKYNLDKAERRKLNESTIERLRKNVAALESVQPKKLTSVDIKARIGATWIDDKDYKEFIATILKTSPHDYQFSLLYNRYVGQYAVKIPSWWRHRAEATNIWGTARMDAVDLFDCALNSRTPTVWDKVEKDGKERRVVNKAETAMAREKLRDMQEEFAKWLWSDEMRRKRYESIYNRTFNNLVIPEYNGDHLKFDGMSEVIQLREHQKSAVARIATGNNTLLHHCVGAGKTFEIIAGAMKLREYGIANKPMIVVPNPLVMQWAKDVKTLYPNAKVLVTTKEEFEKQNRRRFVSKIATGDWDMVIISESQFRRIPVSKERQLAKVENVIERIKKSLEDYQYRLYGAEKSLTVKSLRSALKKKEAKYKELSTKVNKMQDDLIEFEKLGVDWLFVDEAHTYKNKEIETSMTNVAGITSGGSERAFDMEMKIDFLSELHGGDRGVVFATGTPISNSMAEMYTMQSYLAKTSLEKAGIEYFDAWANTFGQVITSWELNTSGSGVKPRTRFSRFVNLPELQKMYRASADVKTAEMLDLPVPTVNRHTITLPATEQILQMNDEIIQRGESIERGGVDPSVDNMLKLTSDGKKLALDPRCLDNNAQDEEGTKVNECIRNVFDIYEKTSDEKSTQVIFCDNSTPKGEGWSVYQDIKDKLMALGVPDEEIAFIHDADTDTKKSKLFKELNAGKVRVLIGSTQKCGVGANFQERLKALHHLDVPYRPSDMEQREGRIIRQGNTNAEVDIYNYITEKTFDSYSYQILENKQRFISQINKGDMSLREASDIDETTLSFAQIKAIATANPDFLRQMELINTVKELRMLKQKHFENEESMRSKLTRWLPESYARTGAILESVKTDIEKVYTESPQIVIDGQKFEERTKAAEAFAIVYRNAKDGQIIGEYGGLKLEVRRSSFGAIGKNAIALRGEMSYEIELGESAIGNLTRIENEYKDIPARKERLENKMQTIREQMDELQANLNKPFVREEELVSAERELADIEERLQVNKDEVVEEVVDGKENDKAREQVRDEEENDRW